MANLQTSGEDPGFGDADCGGELKSRFAASTSGSKARKMKLARRRFSAVENICAIFGTTATPFRSTESSDRSVETGANLAASYASSDSVFVENAKAWSSLVATP